MNFRLKKIFFVELIKSSEIKVSFRRIWLKGDSLAIGLLRLIQLMCCCQEYSKI